MHAPGLPLAVIRTPRPLQRQRYGHAVRLSKWYRTRCPVRWYPGLVPAPASTPKRLRADAQRNRDALLATAGVVFARLGTDVPLEVVAQEAGVGRGTLYRHFPSREHMLAAIMRDNAAVLEERARELTEAPESPDGLADWLGLY